LCPSSKTARAPKLGTYLKIVGHNFVLPNANSPSITRDPSQKFTKGRFNGKQKFEDERSHGSFWRAI
jgi:hypothetical protein